MGYFSQTKGGHDKNGVSTLAPGLLITGNIVAQGTVQIFGRVVGDIQAADVVIGDGAEVEGNVTAPEIAVNGAFKGVLRGHNVRLKGAATVEGEVFSQSLTVEENVQFEGVSRRLEKPIELPTGAAGPAASNEAAPAAITEPAAAAA